VIVVPRGRGLRFAPHVYNTEAEILKAVEALTTF
jgi:selenocysteine lyase/cysteine desulfurase